MSEPTREQIEAVAPLVEQAMNSGALLYDDPANPVVWKSALASHAKAITTAAILAYRAQLEESGFVVVPKVPTEAMLNAAQEAEGSRDWRTSVIAEWAAMISALQPQEPDTNGK